MPATAEDLGYGWLQQTQPLGSRPGWQRKNPEVTVYKAERTTSFFHLDSSAVRGMMGPVGSGKSTGCCTEIMARAVTQPIDSTGKRRSRWSVIRNTYRELSDTTLQTWLDWFPEEQCGRFNRGEMTHEVRLHLADDTTVELDVMFRALDRPADVKKLLSLELTASWVNEAREIPKAIIDMLQTRIGRYPSYRDPAFQSVASLMLEDGTWPIGMTPMDIVNAGGYWSGLIMDTNPPDEDHWWYRIFEMENPDDWRLFRQPSGRGPNAENLQNLKPGYYHATSGKSPEWIKVYFDGEYGYVLDGKPVYSEFTDSFHVTDWATPLPGVEIRVGIDFGLTPAAAFLQQDINGRWRVIDELCAVDMGISRFADLLNIKIQAEYPGFKFAFFGDPAGDQRAQTDEETPFKILRAKGIQATPARTNDFNLRREAVAEPLMRIIDGKPQLAIHPKCRQLRKGMAGKYSYRRIQVIGDERYHDKPDKGIYSHICFVAGTMIDTPTGQARVELLRPGDTVSTPIGPKRVINIGRRPADTMNLGWARCTLDHPIWTLNGFVAAEALQYAEPLGRRSWLWSVHWRLSRCVQQLQNTLSSNLRAAVTTANHQDITQTAASICTEPSGWRIMGTFRAGTIYTTLMATVRTISRRTSSYYQHRSIWPCTWPSPIMWRARGETYSNMQSQPLQPGAIITPKLPALLASAVLADYGAAVSSQRLKKERASSADMPIKCTHLPATSHNSAAQSAARRFAVYLALMISSAAASCVVRALQLTNTVRQDFAAAAVPVDIQRKNVYNIEVEDAHCYYANNRLVSNCEALQYVMLESGSNPTLSLAQQRNPTQQFILTPDWSPFD